jgi:ABC-type branched-subunit amino acid transport system ATPase component/ABC-type branched-subunit amino acid transport system permease subunit
MIVAALVTPQVLLDGVVQGLLFGALAMTIVLVNRSTKVINFAVGAMGLVGAGVVVLCDVGYGIGFWPSLVLGLVVGTAYGAAIELVVIRRLFRAPRVIVLVATIGVAQLSVAVLRAYPDVVGSGKRFPQVSAATWDIAEVQLRATQLAVLVVVPAVAVALSWFLNRTLIGRTVRAASNDPDLARLSGISPKIVSTMVWAVAGLVATTSMILIGGLEGTASSLEALGPNTLLRALAAAVIARLASFRVALVSGVAIGVGQAVLRFNLIDQPGLVDIVLLFVVLIAVWVQSGRAADVDGAFSFAPKVEAMSDRLAPIWWFRHINRIVLLALLAICVALPLVVDQPSRLLLFATIAAFAICAMSLTVLTGWAGQLSLGQMAFAGISALAAAALTRGVSVDWVVAGTRLVAFELYPLPFVVSILIASVVSALLAAVIGAGALRVRGLLLAVTTFAFAIAARSWIYRLDLFADGRATTVRFPRGDLFGLQLDDQRTYYYVVLGTAALVLALLGRLRRRGVGRVTVAVRDNADSAAAFTVRPPVAKLRAFALSGFIAGLGGALLAGAAQQISFSDSPFFVETSLALVAMIVIGGMGSTTGAVIGSIWVVGLPALFPDNPLVPLLSSSLGLLVLLLYFPGGFVQVAYNARAAIARWLDDRVPETPKRATGPPPAILSARARPAAAGPALRTVDLTVTFGGVVANDHVSLDVARGEIVGLIGTNGAGKSTLMNAVGGFVSSTGRVELDGARIDGQGPAARARCGLGRTFQAATLFPELTVRETVQVALEARGRTSLLAVALFSPLAAAKESRKRRDADELIDFLGLGRYADRPVSELSTGTRRIVELAGLLALDARVLCLDEPTAGVAQREAEAMAPLLVEIRRELDASMLVIEHDMPMVMSMSDRIYCLELGRVIAHGDPATVRNDPHVIASYLGVDHRVIDRSDAPRTSVG